MGETRKICPWCLTDLDAIASHETTKHYHADTETLDVTCSVVSRGEVKIIEIDVTFEKPEAGNE